MRDPDKGQPLLMPDTDPPAVEIVEATKRPDLLFVCEHAGRTVPARLDGLGLRAADMDRHIALDIGAEDVARGLAGRLGATLILQRYSRLVIDCNRPPLGTASIPEESDGTRVPGNQGLSDADKHVRVREIFQPWAEACSARAASPRLRAACSIHSFTPTLGDVARPMHIGFCYRRPESRGDALAERFREANPDLTVADNEPYDISDETDWFIPRVAEPLGVSHALIEIRNDLLATKADRARWTDRLARLFAGFSGDLP